MKEGDLGYLEVDRSPLKAPKRRESLYRGRKEKTHVTVTGKGKVALLRKGKRK